MTLTANVHPAFEFVEARQVTALNIEVQQYRHRVSGARHIHVVADDNNNAFLVAFLTVPQDSTGVAHILEHTSLCGSRRFPVRDPFFMMTRRSLSTFMNAFTSSDWTAYPFASQNRKDFDNLLQVYLDAAFFPRLDRLDFAQEGQRLEFEVPDDPTSDLVYRGVVYNEMKGAMSSPTQVLWQFAHQHLFPTTTYHHNSGGDPEHIVDLTYEQLKAFHARHYHPSNAVFMTYGDIAAGEHQGRFEELALAEFSRGEGEHSVPDERRYAAPVRARERYALNETEDNGKRCYVLLSWLLGPCTDRRHVIDAQLLEGVLLDHSASPLRHALETSNLGTAPVEMCGLDDSTRELGFFAGLEGAAETDADAIAALILATLEEVAAHGVPQQQVESVLHQMELAQREITGGAFPYGLRLLVNVLGPAIHGADPLQVLDIDSLLASLREDIRDEGFVRRLVREHLLDNPHRVHLIMAPDRALAQQRRDRERQRLAAIVRRLGEDDRQALIERGKALRARQQAQEDAEVLPKVTLKDVPQSLRIPSGWRGTISACPTTWYPQGTNGMVYQQIVSSLPDLQHEELGALPLFCSCVSEVGCGELDYLAAQAWQASVTGAVSAHLSVRTAVDDPTSSRGYYVLHGKALARNAGGLAEVLRMVFEEARFDERDRVRELIGQLRAHADTAITDRGHAFALLAACAGLTPAAGLAHRWNGLAGVRTLRALDDDLRSAERLQGLLATLERIREHLLHGPLQILSVGEPQRFAETSGAITRHWPARPRDPEGYQPLVLPPDHYRVRQAWVVDTAVSFCAKAYPTVPTDHPDAAVLAVAGELLRNGFLHTAIRERGGAYGAGAGYDSDASALRFYSYRDPRLAGTLTDFDRSVEWLASGAPDERALEEAILGLIATIDRPDSPAGEAVTAFFGELHGRSGEQRRRVRQRILAVTLGDLQRVADLYLQPQGASVAVLTNDEHLAAASGLDFERRAL